MVSPSHLRPSFSAPSANLLRFLRTQSDGCATNFPRCEYQRRCFSARGHLPLKAALNEPRLRDRTSPNQTPSIPSLTPLRPRPLSGLANSKSHLLRTFTTTPKRSRHLLRRILGLHRQPPQEKLRPDDLPMNPGVEEGYEGNMFNIGRGLAAKATNEPRLRCTELDENGNVTLVNGEFRKSELIAKVCMLCLYCIMVGLKDNWLIVLVCGLVWPSSA